MNYPHPASQWPNKASSKVFSAQNQTMFDQILSTLQKEATPVLMSKLGLDQDKAKMSVGAATESVKEVLGAGKGFELKDALSLFSSSQNSSGAEGMLGKLGSVLQSKLTGQVGLDSAKAGGVSAMLLPMVTDLISKHVGGDPSKLSGLLGGLADGGDMSKMATGMLGKLFK